MGSLHLLANEKEGRSYVLVYVSVRIIHLVLGGQEQVNCFLVQEEAFCHLPNPTRETFERQRASSLSTRAYTHDIWTRTDASHNHTSSTLFSTCMYDIESLIERLMWEKERDCTSTNADCTEQSVRDPSFLRMFHESQLEPWMGRGLGGVFWSCENEAANRGAVRAKASMSSVPFILWIVARDWVFQPTLSRFVGFFKLPFEFAKRTKKNVTGRFCACEAYRFFNFVS